MTLNIGVNIQMASRCFKSGVGFEIDSTDSIFGRRYLQIPDTDMGSVAQFLTCGVVTGRKGGMTMGSVCNWGEPP